MVSFSSMPKACRSTLAPRRERIQDVLGDLPQGGVHRASWEAERRLILDEMPKCESSVVADRRSIEIGSLEI